jgi:hypothetical protein
MGAGSLLDVEAFYPMEILKNTMSDAIPLLLFKSDATCQLGMKTCPFRKSYPDVLVVQSSQDRNGNNGARSLNCSMQGRIFP